MRSLHLALSGASPSSGIIALVSECAVALGDRPLLNISALSQTTDYTRRRNSITMVGHLPLVGGLPQLGRVSSGDLDEAPRYRERSLVSAVSSTALVRAKMFRSRSASDAEREGGRYLLQLR